MEDARSSSCWVGLKILKARGDQQRQFGQTDLPLAALLGWARCSWEHKGCAVPVLEPAAAVGGCVRAAEALRKHSYSQPMALGRTCPWLAALGLRELCKCSVPTTAAPGGFVLRPRSWHALLLLVFLNSFLGVRLQPRICGTGEGLEQRSDRIPNVWPELRLPAVCGLQKPQTGLSAAAWGAARLLEELRTLGVV